ncbi:TolC family protein [Chitinophagaceae bacterium LB-8]|uniref:TolC family protein n=1 Tax=Paraflavisolibacter caeni TaxID=2982496 RepID=A0A9X3BJX5_9BACT|nr:TolC family protein [Paraflavisolibacter caeni]MCU7551768.1 TolC family protein [Paraflavisolibacter caeni]
MRSCLLREVRLIVIIVIKLSIVFATSDLYAQQTNDADSVWSLTRCIAYARQNNLQVTSSRLNEQAIEQDLLLSKAAKYPNLVATATQALGNSNANNFSAGTSNSSFSGSYLLNSAFTLYNGNYLNNDIRQKDLQVKAAQQDVLATENNIILQITQAYLQIILAKENVTYFTNLVQTAQAQTQEATVKFKAGSIAKTELAQLQSQLSSDQYGLVNATNTERQAIFNLKQLLQLPANADFQIEMPDTLHVIADHTSLTDAENAALKQRPEIKSSEIARKAAHYQLLKEVAARKPLLILNSSLASNYSNNLPKDYGSQIDHNIYGRTGLTLSFALFNNRSVKTNIAKAQIASEQSDVDLRNTQTILSQQVEQAYINSLNTQALLDAAQKQLDANEQSFSISQEQLRLGAITAIDFLVQKNLYVQAMQLYLQAKYNAQIAVQVYRFYKGDPIEL